MRIGHLRLGFSLAHQWRFRWTHHEYWNRLVVGPFYALVFHPSPVPEKK